MAVGDLITRAQLDGVDLSTVSWTSDNALSPNGGTSYLYVACYSWTFKAVGNYWFFGSPNYNLYLDYWDGTAWKNVGSTGSFKNATRWINVNNGSGSGNVNSHLRTWVWRVRITANGGYYKGEMDGYLYLCGMGHCKETSYPKGAYISKTKTGFVYKVLKRSGANTDTSQDSGFNVKPWDSKLGGLYETSELRGTAITLPSKNQCRFVPKLDDTYIPIGISINPS